MIPLYVAELGRQWAEHERERRRRRRYRLLLVALVLLPAGLAVLALWPR